MLIRLTWPALALSASASLTAAPLPQDMIIERSVAAHESFLASEALQGRESATRDEAIAAAYVAAQFQSYGLTSAPGVSGYFQKATVIRQKLIGVPTLTIGGTAIEIPTIILSSGQSLSGQLSIKSGPDASALSSAPVVFASNKDADALALLKAASEKRVKLLILRESDSAKKLLKMIGGRPRLPIYLEGSPEPTGLTVIVLPDTALKLAADKAGSAVALNITTSKEQATTTNAIGYLKGSDANAGTLLLTAHLDHLGRSADGAIRAGANDDASGTTAVLELAKVVAAGKRPRRGILFVCYGSEEIGGFGSTYFGQHPPVPLNQIVANLEFEMIGAQDPNLPRYTLMMTGFERSNLGTALKQHGAHVTGDPYPEQHFFERSDNFALALKGVVAHTVSGWAVTPTYHQASDTMANLDIPFMTKSIQSLVAPVKWLANSDFVPAWNEGGKPKE